MKYAVVIEQGLTSWGASVPDLPGCVAVAASREEVERLIQEAIAIHLDGMRQHNLPIPEPVHGVAMIEVK